MQGIFFHLSVETTFIRIDIADMFLRISRCLEIFARVPADSERRSYSRRLDVRQL